MGIVVFEWRANSPEKELSDLKKKSDIMLSVFWATFPLKIRDSNTKLWFRLLWNNEVVTEDITFIYLFF